MASRLVKVMTAYRTLPPSTVFWIMDHTVTALERAFQLAKSGTCDSVADLKKRLRTEGYSITQITGRVLSKQLDALIKAARG
jgi:hypothetical protein